MTTHKIEWLWPNIVFKNNVQWYWARHVCKRTYKQHRKASVVAGIEFLGVILVCTAYPQVSATEHNGEVLYVHVLYKDISIHGVCVCVHECNDYIIRYRMNMLSK